MSAEKKIYIKKNNYLSSKIIYFLPLIFLVPQQAAKSPWWPLPTSGPLIFMFFAATLLLFLFVYETLQESTRIKLTLAQKLFIFWIIHTFISYSLVVAGFRPSLEFIGARIYTGIPPYFLAFMVFLVIEKNNWKIKDFENVIKALLFVSAIWSIESFLTFYLGLSIPGLWSVGWDIGQEWYSSGFTNSLHTVSKTSLIIFWLSIYMYYIYNKPSYLLFSMGSFLTIISTMNRASIAVLVVSLMIFLYLIFIRYSDRKKVETFTIKKSLKGLLGIFAIAVILAGSVIVNNFRGSILADSAAVTERAYQYSRAVETIIHFPYGTGAGLGYNYCYSDEVPQLFTDDLAKKEPFATFSKFYQSGILGADLQQKYVGLSGNVFSIHNFSLNIIMDYGIFALIILILYIIWLFKFLRFTKLLFNSKYQLLGTSFLCLVLAQGSVFLAMQATYKFFAWMWLLVFLFLFTKAIIRGSVEEQRKQMERHNSFLIPLNEIKLLEKI